MRLRSVEVRYMFSPTHQNHQRSNAGRRLNSSMNWNRIETDDVSMIQYYSISCMYVGICVQANK